MLSFPSALNRLAKTAVPICLILVSGNSSHNGQCAHRMVPWCTQSWQSGNHPRLTGTRQNCRPYSTFNSATYDSDPRRHWCVHGVCLPLVLHQEAYNPMNPCVVHQAADFTLNSHYTDTGRWSQVSKYRKMASSTVPIVLMFIQRCSWSSCHSLRPPRELLQRYKEQFKAHHRYVSTVNQGEQTLNKFVNLKFLWKPKIQSTASKKLNSKVKSSDFILYSYKRLWQL